MALMDEGDADYDYSVAFVDLMARGRATGRAVLTRARFARADEVAGAEAQRRRYDPAVLVTAPPGRAVGSDEPAQRAAPSTRSGTASPRHGAATSCRPSPPSSTRSTWSTAGTACTDPAGFLQWQYVVPFGAEDVVRHTVRPPQRQRHHHLRGRAQALRRRPTPGPLSFPMPGWTLAVDIPVGPAGLGRLLDELDEAVVAAGGRIYLAKDSRVRPELLAAMYPDLDEWRAVRRRVDPDQHLRSDLARRLGL